MATINITQIQQQLFQVIKERLGEGLSLADEIATLLDLSRDSAYRRTRGENQISFEELCKICLHYRISFDQLMNIPASGFIFQGRFLNNKSFRFDEYLQSILAHLSYINNFKEKEFFYLCKESPLFHQLYFREFAAFKYYFWLGVIMLFPEFKDKKVDFEEYPEDIFQTGQKIINVYNQIDSVEIWNIECLNSHLRQLDFFRDGGMFKSDADVLKIYESMEKTLDHLEKQAELGYKFAYDDESKKPLGKFRMYFNEVVIGDNHMLAVMDHSKVAFIPHSVANYLMTRDMVFCEHFYEYLQNMIRRSTLISEVSEKERSKFFKLHRQRLEQRKASLHL